jgi:hypothetical protein
MGAHKTNPQSLYRESLPNLAPLGELAQANVSLEVVPKATVTLVPPENIRIGPDGTRQLLEPNSDGLWLDIPEGADICPAGELLPVSKCDVVATLFSIRGSERVPVAAMRFPLEKWRDAHSIVKLVD